MITVYTAAYVLKEGEKEYQIQHQAGLSLLCYGLKTLYHLAVDEKEVLTMLEHGGNGKPYLKRYPGIHFNISHCDGLATCAFFEKPIGVDMEKVGDFNASIIRKVLTDNEQEFLLRYKEEKERYDELFYRFWTLKESYLKWEGCGFYKDPKEVSFELDLNGRITCSDTRVDLWQIKTEENCILSVCAESMGTVLHERIVLRRKNSVLLEN